MSPKIRRLVCALSLSCLVAAALAAPAHASEPTEPNIVGGSEVSQVDFDARWEFMATLMLSDLADPDEAFICGGSVIDTHLVLTAAHCVTDEDGWPIAPGELKVAVGKRRLSTVAAGDRIGVSAIFVHPRYNPSELIYDVAVVRLASAAPAGATPVPLIQDGPADGALWGDGDDDNVNTGFGPGDDATGPWVAGWGARTGEGESFPDALHQVKVPIVSDEGCESQYLSWFRRYGIVPYPIDTTMVLCAGDLAPNASSSGKDACYGDSGGPLIVGDGAGGHKQVGVVSGGLPPCANHISSGVYSRIDNPSIRGFIESIPTGVSTSGPGGLQPPGTPTLASSTLTSVTVSWAGPPGPPVATGYTLYRRYRFLSIDYLWPIAYTTRTSHTVRGMLPGRTISLVVRSRTPGGHSGNSTFTSFTTLPDDARPSRPGRPRPIRARSNAVAITWPRSTDNHRVRVYEVWMRAPGRSLRRVGSATGNRFVRRRLRPDTRYEFRVRALDYSGNRSRFSGERAIRTRG